MTPTEKATPAQLLAVFIALQVLLVATYFFAHSDLGKFGVPIALLIATIKALLVVLYFMHARSSPGIHRVAAGVGIFWLGILISLTLSDYLTRDWLQLPGAWPKPIPSLTSKP